MSFPMMSMSPGTRRIRRGREGYVLDNVTAAPFVTNDIEPGRFAVDNCPDEMVIFARGRRSIPLTFSPDVASIAMRQQRLSMGSQGPMRQTNIDSRLLLPRRSSPRKRLTLSDSPPSSTVHTPTFSPAVSAKPPSSTVTAKPPSSCPPSITPSPDTIKWSPVSKKCHLDNDFDESKDPSTALKGLTKAQLLTLISQVMAAKPELADEVKRRIPEPDLPNMEEILRNSKRNISRSLPSTRLESKTDSMAYNRVFTHLVSFKKSLLEQCKCLTEACAWKSVVDHMIMAWGYVKATPVWDNPSHNNIRKSCFKALATNCMLAMKKSSWNAEFCQDLRNKLKPLEKDSDDITACIKHLDHIINNGNVSN